ncbi:glutathione peroxidase [Caldalkalibacillus thermarum TA2.A1]|uniref:Glutathione peroxidase n=1 Tax=Caldalkalibacillus thermarum (strain TA2.A1) TaxID=986075 RepID=F5LBD8_CALTT|nr:glutathione peroxidase [Caldalkalibacillus thermarum]EGL81345.1 glutathione peroxidase [Caldalkalibacillus thermarum TA2.A1]QZT35176.1 glutathione peroxidase [Caldalkalibacillus thermarum TA2.A1]
MSIFDYSACSINGTKQSLAAYKGQVVLIVNTASRCGFTPQYSGLEKLYQTYKDRGFVVLGFPCNQFMNQEPGTEEEILSFCQTNYQVSFPMFAKVKVKGPEAHPLFQYLTSQAKGILSDEIKWNFTKFLADQNGQVVKRYAPTTTPEKIAPDIERLLEEKGR